MARYYVPITMADFELKARAAFEKQEENYDFSAAIEKDLSKVEFDKENITGPDDTDGYAKYPTGFRQVTSDFPVLFVNAGGDWEFPICFVLYWDGKQIRAYIPDKGNAYNRKLKSAYGNNDEADDMDENVDPHDIWDKEISEFELLDDVRRRIIKKS